MPANGAKDAASAVVFIVAIHQGVIPLVAGLVFDRRPALALAPRLPTPWWWLTCLAVVAVAVALLEAIDRLDDGSGDDAGPPGRRRSGGGGDDGHPTTTEEHG